jgi:hypothetical protein
VTRATVKELLLLPDDQIDYPSLDSGLLLELATQREEPFLATSALGELTQRKDGHAREAADRILHAAIWDKHLTAYALTVLFDRDPTATLQHMVRLIDICDEPKLLEAMAENVLNGRDYFQDGDGQRVLGTLVAKLRNIVPAKFSDPETIKRVMALV